MNDNLGDIKMQCDQCGGYFALDCVLYIDDSYVCMECAKRLIYIGDNVESYNESEVEDD